MPAWPTQPESEDIVYHGAVAAGAEVREQGGGEGYGAEEVGLELVVPVERGQGFDGPGEDVGGVVEEDVDVAVAAKGL